MAFADEKKIITSHVCAKCVGGCCNHYTPSVVFLTFHEIKRIMEVTGLPAKFIARYGETEKAFFKEMSVLGDFQYVFNGKRSVFLRSVDGKCVFLTPKGCSLPHNVKPAVCRAFPLWYDKTNGKKRLYLAEDLETCPLAVKHAKDKTLTPVIREMNETTQSLHAVLGRYDKEIKVFRKYKPYLESASIKDVMAWMEEDKLL